MNETEKPEAGSREGVERIKVTPTLLIGLGGTGGDVLLRVRKRIFEKYGSIDAFPVVSYLWVDTDISGKDVIAREFTDAVAFRPPERVMTTIDHCADIIDHLDTNPDLSHIREWWYPGLNTVPALREGAGQVRAYSRLGFFQYYERLQDALRSRSDIIRDPNLKHSMVDSPVIQRAGGIEFNPGPGINVYIICSLAGGTGSGMFLDMAFLAKRMFDDATTVGYLLLPRFFSASDRKMDANGYAALKELSYYSTVNFDVKWKPSQQQTIPIPLPPFSFCYLLDSKNMDGEVVGSLRSTREAVLEMLADTIFKDFTHGSFADQKRSCRVNIGPKLVGFRPARRAVDDLVFEQRFPLRFQSLGMASIVMPHDRIITACAYRLGCDVVDYWGGLSVKEFNIATLTQVVRDELFPHPEIRISQDIVKGQQRNDLVDAAGREVTGGGQIVTTVEAWAKEVLAKVGRGVPAQNRKPIRTFLEEETEQEKNLFTAEEKHPKPQQWGDIARAVYQNGETLKASAKTGLRRQVDRLIGEQNYSIGHVVALLRRAAFVLKDDAHPYGPRLAKQAQELETKIPKAQTACVEALASLAQHENRSNWDGRKSIILEYDLDCWRRAIVGTARDPGYLRLVLMARIYRTAADVCRAVADYIEQDLAAGLERLNEDLRGFQRRLQVRLGHFRDNRPADLSLLLYDARDFDAIYARYVGEADARQRYAAEVSRAVLQRLGKQVIDLPALAVGDEAQKLEDVLLDEGRPRFQAVRADYHVVTQFAEKPQAERIQHLQRMMAKARPLIYGSETKQTRFDFPTGTKVLVVGIPEAPRSVPTAVAAKIDAARRDLISLMQAHLKEVAGAFFPIPDSSEIIFYNECGAFPINYITEMETLRERYDEAVAAGERLHTTCHDRVFPDLMVLDPDHQLRPMAEASECLALGCLFGVVQVEKAGAAVRYYWTEKVGLNTFQRTLGEQPNALHELARSERVRQQHLLPQIRRALERIKSHKDDLARYYVVLNAEYRRAVTDEKGQLVPEEKRSFEEVVLARVLEARLQEAVHAATVARLWNSEEEFSRDVEANYAPKQRDFCKDRADGGCLLQLPMAQST